MDSKLKVMLTTEGTYPFHQGGVSTWCDTLVNKVDDIDYVIYSIVMNPFVTQKFTLPKSASMFTVPLWGTEEPSEHLLTPFSEVYLSKKRTDDSTIRQNFIPLFNDLIDEVVRIDKDPKRFGNILLELHKYFQYYEYKKSFKSQPVWEAYKKSILDFSKKTDQNIHEPNVYSMIQSLGWIYRFLNILNTPVPDVHVTHSAAAAFCGIPGVLAKLKNNTPFLLTEHGVYLREQYLSLSSRGYSSFLNTFLVRLIGSVTNLNYSFADQVSPVCMYNTRWEKKLGVDPKRIQVIYNGIDKKIFTPSTSIQKNIHPTVVCVARIDPIKDILSLIKSASYVKDKIPDVKFVVYGSVTVPEYYDKCLEARSELNLNDTVIFAGHTNDIPSAYRSGDVIVPSSISEAFPYSVVEAMMIGKPVIATDVGGIKEALGDTGVVVRPQQPEDMAKAIINMLENPALRESLGEDARNRALNYFTLDRIIGMYFKSYINLAVGQRFEKISLSGSFRKQKLLFEKGYALLKFGYNTEAVIQFKNAIKEASGSTMVPIILTASAEAYNQMGMYTEAYHEMEKAEAMAEILDSKSTA